MNERSEQHLARLKKETVADMDTKFRKGDAEHGGDLLDMESLRLIDEAIGEATDQIVYLRTLRGQIVRMQKLLKMAERQLPNDSMARYVRDSILTELGYKPCYCVGELYERAAHIDCRDCGGTGKLKMQEIES